MLRGERLLAVMVKLPFVLKVTTGLIVPATSAEFAGNVALASLAVVPMMSATVVMRFQLASTALTVTPTLTPAICAMGVPVLPAAVPGAAVSPGASNCNFTNAPGFTVALGLVAEVNPVALAVTVRVPAVLNVSDES